MRERFREIERERETERSKERAGSQEPKPATRRTVHRADERRFQWRFRRTKVEIRRFDGDFRRSHGETHNPKLVTCTHVTRWLEG